MISAVVDTNVLVAANRLDVERPDRCAAVCRETLSELLRVGRVCVDDQLRILREYMPYTSFSGQPGVGDAFFKWVFENQGDENHCERVAIVPRDESRNDFMEFPDDPDLATFDPSDRKFVAVAVASKHNPIIFNATDSGWWIHHEALKRYVNVVLLCPDELQRGRKRP